MQGHDQTPYLLRLVLPMHQSVFYPADQLRDYISARIVSPARRAG